MDVRGKNIYVGLSGGVDSAVSAALLKRAGARVTGVFIKGWYPPGMPCTWANERRDAMRVAARLQIPFHTFDASVAYKKNVIDYLRAEYRAGRTPNPDVMCNREVKFGVFYRYARATGAEYIATGHYLSGEKDQRYFLWAVPQAIIAQTIFPVGEMKKNEVRSLAKRFRIPIAEKKDSQGVCFLGNISVDEFLRGEFGETPGRALDGKGALVGMHDGVLLYTLGERVPLKKTRETGPWFVRAKDIAKNELTVGETPLQERVPDRREVLFTDANWFQETDGLVEAQYRYRGKRIQGYIEKNRFASVLPFPEIPAPGQSIVFYRNDELVGGGIIAA